MCVLCDPFLLGLDFTHFLQTPSCHDPHCIILFCYNGTPTGIHLWDQTHTHMSVCVVTPHTENIMPVEQLVQQVLAKLEESDAKVDAKLSSIEARLTRLEQGQPPVSQFLPSKAKSSEAKAKSEPVVQSSESKAHHEMKALLKALPKAKQKSFTKAWKTLQKSSKWPTGTMPKPKYFELQMQAYASVA